MARIINGWIDADWNDDFVNEDQQRDEHECEVNNREGPMEVDDLMLQHHHRSTSVCT